MDGTLLLGILLWLVTKHSNSARARALLPKAGFLSQAFFALDLLSGFFKTLQFEALPAQSVCFPEALDRHRSKK